MLASNVTSLMQTSESEKPAKLTLAEIVSFTSLDDEHMQELALPENQNFLRRLIISEGFWEEENYKSRVLFLIQAFLKRVFAEKTFLQQLILEMLVGAPGKTFLEFYKLFKECEPAKEVMFSTYPDVNDSNDKNKNLWLKIVDRLDVLLQFGFFHHAQQMRVDVIKCLMHLGLSEAAYQAIRKLRNFFKPALVQESFSYALMIRELAKGRSVFLVVGNGARRSATDMIDILVHQCRISLSPAQQKELLSYLLPEERVAISKITQERNNVRQSRVEMAKLRAEIAEQKDLLESLLDSEETHLAKIDYLSKQLEETKQASSPKRKADEYPERDSLKIARTSENGAFMQPLSSMAVICMTGSSEIIRSASAPDVRHN